MRFLKQLVFICFLSSVWSCGDSSRELPILGQTDVSASGDTTYHKIPDFAFINQNGDSLTQDFVKDKVYVTDFFFTSCPTICPVMKTQMIRVYEKFQDNPNFGIISHTIDPRHDSISVLKEYKDRLGIKGDSWQFVTGEQEKIYEIAQKDYMVSALEDSTAVNDGGFVHSGAFVLIDKQKRIRGVYDGTKEVEVNKLIKDIELLLKK